MVNTISKEDISKLPQEEFAGKIIVVQSESEAEKAVGYLETHQSIGFDSETRPAFKKGTSHKIALIQLSTEDTCFLFRANMIGIPTCLANLLTNANVKKIGLSLRDDFSAIRKREDMEPKNCIDLQGFVKDYGIEDNSLQRIYAILFDKRISKGQRLSNWEADMLTDGQKKYAALDAWACLRIYNELLNRDVNK